MSKAKVLTALMMSIGAMSIAACNTMEGVGKDVQAAGETVEEAADEAEDDLTDNDPN